MERSRAWAASIVNTFEKSLVLDVPEHEFQMYQTHKSIYQEPMPLKPGRYKLSLVLKDDLNGHMGPRNWASSCRT